MLMFDIGANRGDAVLAGLKQGYKVIAIEAAPRVYAELVRNFIYNPNVVPLRYAVSDSNNERLEFYEAIEDGLSTLNKDWLTKNGLPYAGKPFRTIQANTITIDKLAENYGEPDLIKIDVEGAEWNVFRGMTRAYEIITFEWTLETLAEHEKQLDYLYELGYREFAFQYIMPHLYRPRVWERTKSNNSGVLYDVWNETKEEWIHGGWKLGNLRPTADVGMLWLR